MKRFLTMLMVCILASTATIALAGEGEGEGKGKGKGRGPHARKHKGGEGRGHRRLGLKLTDEQKESAKKIREATKEKMDAAETKEEKQKIMEAARKQFHEEVLTEEQRKELKERREARERWIEPRCRGRKLAVDAGDLLAGNITGLGSSTGGNNLSGYGFNNVAPWAIDASGTTGGPPSIGAPDPSKIRPIIASPTGNRDR